MPYDIEINEGRDDPELDSQFDESDFDSVDADADALASAGWGTDEDYGYFGDE